MNSTMTNELKLIITGIGGQGIVFLTRLISHTAVNLGYAVVVSETHGMSQRGGSVISHLKINGSESPLVQRGTARPFGNRYRNQRNEGHSSPPSATYRYAI